MFWSTILALAAVAEAAPQFGGGNAVTMLRFGCTQVVIDRIDPLVNPGQAPTGHIHQIVGGNAFNVTMPVTDIAQLATCTTCQASEDFSNYWTANLYFRHKNGSYKRVPQGGAAYQFNDRFSTQTNGGILVYYVSAQPGKVTAFKPGFRMLVGNAAETQDSRVSRANICHRCWNRPTEDQFVGGAPCTGSDTVAIPQSNTCNMIRQTLIFPACWDGKNLDSPDHKSHVAYGQGSGANGGGACPSSHPVKTPQVMYELMWDANNFVRNKDWWPADGKPYTYSMNLGGSAAHGDYVFGWKGDSLQRAMDKNCNLNRDCPAAGLHYQEPAKYNACKIKQQAPEPVDGWLKAMPMGEPILKA